MGGGIWEGAGTQGRDGAAAGESISLGQDKTYPFAPRDVLGCGGNGVTPKLGRAGGVHGCRQGPGKGQILAVMLLAEEEPGSVRAAEAAGLPYKCPGTDGQWVGCSWGCFGTSDGSPGLSVQLARQGEELQDSRKPSAGKEELTKPCPCPAVTKHHQPFRAGDSFGLCWGPGRPVLSGARGRGDL